MAKTSAGTADMEMMVWNIILSVGVAAIGFLAKGKIEELERLGVLLSKTREESARDHVTRAEVHQSLDRLVDRIDGNFRRLEDKLDALSQREHT